MRMIDNVCGVFDDAEIIFALDAVRQQQPRQTIEALRCPVCSATFCVNFDSEGKTFDVACRGKVPHCSTVQDITEPPSWWRDCVREPQASTFYWVGSHTFGPNGGLSMPASGYDADGSHWSGGMHVPLADADYGLWCWIIRHSGCTETLVNDQLLAELRQRYQHAAAQGHVGTSTET